MKCEKLLQMIDELYEEYLQVWEDVCSIESPTDDKEAVDAVGRYFADLAGKKGWLVETLPVEGAGNPLCITINPEVPGKSVVFSGHIDTVHPKGLFGFPVVRRDETKLYGPGVMDCKGGVVASFMAMDALERCGFEGRPVHLLIQTDEETGSRNSGKKTIDFLCKKSENARAFLNTEGIVGDTAVLIRKGILRVRFRIKGKAVHSANCVSGSNAIAEAAHKIIELEKWKDAEGLTCNCGVIKGGTVANTVAAECMFLADIRFANPLQYEEALQRIKEIADQTFVAGCLCELEHVSFRPAMPYTEKNQELLDTMNRIYRENGLPVLGMRKCLSGSDAAYITEAGIPCVDNIGVAGGMIHSVEEFALLSSLSEAAKRLALTAYCI